MPDLAHAELEIAVDRGDLVRRAADWLAHYLSARPGVLSVALSGGTTPQPVYERLAAAPLPWPRIHWFWGDERFVSPDDPASNYRMVRAALLERAPVPPENVHRIPTAGAPEDAAAAYDDELRRFAREVRPGKPLFDAVLLGVGGDGHTASLFPGGAALEERARWAVAVAASPVARITLTLPALDNSAAVAFIAAGAEKRAPLARILAGDKSLPAARVETGGEMRCFLDRDAAPPR